MRNLFEQEARKYDAPDGVIDRLLQLGATRGYVAWVVDRLLDRDDPAPSLSALALAMGLDEEVVRSAHYQKRPRSVEELQQTRGFGGVMKFALLMHPDEAFWLSLMRYCRREVTQVVVGEMLTTGVPIKTIVKETGIAMRTVYRLREPFIAEFLQRQSYDPKSVR